MEKDRFQIAHSSSPNELLSFIVDDIRRLNGVETKSLEAKVLKFNEEFGEFSAEVVKLLGHTYKRYDRDHLVEEMADSMQCLISIFLDIESRTDISFMNDVLPTIVKKNQKWEDKIKDYTSPHGPRAVLTICDLIQKYPETISWGGKDATISFVCNGHKLHDVIIYEAGVRGPADYLIYNTATDKWDHRGYSGVSKTLDELVQYVISTDEHNKKYRK